MAVGISNAILKLISCLRLFFSYCLMSYIVLYRINSLHSNEECCTLATRYCVACSQLNSGAIWPCVLWHLWPLSLPLSLKVTSIGQKHATVENNNWKRTSTHGWIQFVWASLSIKLSFPAGFFWCNQQSKIRGADVKLHSHFASTDKYSIC